MLTAITAEPTTTSATIRWTSNEPATSQVQYGPTAAYGSTTTLNPATVTSHQQTINGLTPGTTYHYRVHSTDAAGNTTTSPGSTFTTASIPTEPASEVFLSDLDPTGTPVNGWGPYERDRANGEQRAGDGGPLTIAGTVYAKGLGVHARSELTYTIPASCRFRAQVGVDDKVGNAGSVVFQVWNGTTTMVHQSPRKTGADGPPPSTSTSPASPSSASSSPTAATTSPPTTPTGPTPRSPAAPPPTPTPTPTPATRPHPC